MGKYLKLFKTHAEYELFIQTDFDKPNVSYCEDNKDVHFNPVEARLVCKYNVTSISKPTLLRADVNNIFKSMEIDGVMLNEFVTEYTFDTIGVHTVKYELYDETNLGDSAFYNCRSLTSVITPNSVTSIGSDAFKNCTSLASVAIGSGVTSIGNSAFTNCTSITEVTIPDSVTSISGYAFYNCTGLTSVRSLAMAAPKIKNSTFQNVKTSGILTVPIGSSGYDVWMGTGDYYLGKYNWTKVEQ